MTDDTNTLSQRARQKYYWESQQFEVGYPLQSRIILCSPGFDTAEEAKQDAERNVKRITTNWCDSRGGTSKYTIKMGDPKDD